MSEIIMIPGWNGLQSVQTTFKPGCRLQATNRLLGLMLVVSAGNCCLNTCCVEGGIGATNGTNWQCTRLVFMPAAGNVFFLEVNPNCGVFYPPEPREQMGSADFILGLDQQHGGHAGFIDAIVEAALQRDRARKAAHTVQVRFTLAILVIKCDH